MHLPFLALRVGFLVEARYGNARMYILSHIRFPDVPRSPDELWPLVWLKFHLGAVHFLLQNLKAFCADLWAFSGKFGYKWELKPGLKCDVLTYLYAVMAHLIYAAKCEPSECVVVFDFKTCYLHELFFVFTNRSTFACLCACFNPTIQFAVHHFEFHFSVIMGSQCMVRLGSQILEDAKNFQVCKMCKDSAWRWSASIFHHKRRWLHFSPRIQFQTTYRD